MSAVSARGQPRVAPSQTSSLLSIRWQEDEFSESSTSQLLVDLWEQLRSQSLVIGAVTLITPRTEVTLQPSPNCLTLEIESLLRFLQGEGVVIKNHREIRDYLCRFPSLIDVVRRAAKEARRHFPDAQLVLDLYQDPEIDDCYLVVYVRLHRYDDSLLEKLKQGETAVLKSLENREGWILLTTDFRSPEEEDAF